MTDDSPTPAQPTPDDLGGHQDGSLTSGDATQQPSTRKRWPVWAGIGVVIAGAAVALVMALTSESEEAPVPTPTEVAQPSPSPTPTPSPSVTPSPSTSPSPSATPEGPVVISEIKTMSFSPVWDPPDHGQDFWQIVDPKQGYPESGGTQYVLAHACAAGDCAGDEFRKLEVGDTLTYKGETYQVEDRRKVWKDEIAQQDIWYHDPDRIVLITCVIEVQGVRAVQNDLLIATRSS